MEYRWTNLSLLQWKKIQYVNMGIINLVPEVEVNRMTYQFAKYMLTEITNNDQKLYLHK